MFDPLSAVSSVNVPQCVACLATDRVSTHYGVLSCFGCKAFFRRTIHEGRKYTCRTGGHCIVINENRNQCRACRFDRCLNGGMNVKRVREERHLKKREIDLDSTVLSVALDEHPIIRMLVNLEYSLDRGEPQSNGIEVKRSVMKEFNIPEMNLRNINYNASRIVMDEDITEVCYRTMLTKSDWVGGFDKFSQMCHSDQMILYRQNFLLFSWLHYLAISFEKTKC